MSNLLRDLIEEGWVAWVLMAAALLGSLAFTIWVVRL